MATCIEFGSGSSRHCQSSEYCTVSHFLDTHQQRQLCVVTHQNENRIDYNVMGSLSSLPLGSIHEQFVFKRFRRRTESPWNTFDHLIPMKPKRIGDELQMLWHLLPISSTIIDTRTHAETHLVTLINYHCRVFGRWNGQSIKDVSFKANCNLTIIGNESVKRTEIVCNWPLSSQKQNFQWPMSIWSNFNKIDNMTSNVCKLCAVHAKVFVVLYCL